MSINCDKKCSEVDGSLIVFGDFKVYKNVKGMKWAYPKYGDGQNNLYIQFPNIQLSTYGFPKKDDYHTQEQRNYIKVPISHPQHTCCIECLNRLDFRFGSDEFKQLMFGDNWERYQYTPLLRNPGDGKPLYAKVKLMMSYEEHAIETEVYMSIDGVKKHIDIEDVDDVAMVVSYMSDVKCIVKLSKLWTLANYKYGITLTLTKIHVDTNDVVAPDIDFIDD